MTIKSQTQIQTWTISTQYKSDTLIFILIQNESYEKLQNLVKCHQILQGKISIFATFYNWYVTCPTITAKYLLVVKFWGNSNPYCMLEKLQPTQFCT